MSENIIDIVSFLAAFASFWALLPHAKGLVVRIISNRRALTKIRKSSNADQTYEEDDDESSESIGLHKKGPKFTNKTFVYIAKLNPEVMEEIELLLLQAGMRSETAMETFMKIKVYTSLGLFLFFLLILLSFEMPILMVIPISIPAAVMASHRLTNANLTNLAAKRKEAIENGVPDLIDLLVICTESGLDLNRAIKRIAREMRTSNPTLADELSLTAIELEMIPDHNQVFQNLEIRTDCIAIRTLSKTFSQSMEYGSSLAVSLRDLAVESRQKRMLNAEAKAAQAPTLLTLPMMFCIMPCLFIVMLGPVIIGMINSFREECP